MTQNNRSGVTKAIMGAAAITGGIVISSRLSEATERTLTARIRPTTAFIDKWGVGYLGPIFAGIEDVFLEVSDGASIRTGDVIDYDKNTGEEDIWDDMESRPFDEDVLFIAHYQESVGDEAGTGGEGVAVIGPNSGEYYESMWLASHETGHAIGYSHSDGDYEVRDGNLFFSTMHVPDGDYDNYIWTGEFP